MDESIECNIPLGMFRVLVEANASARSICMSVEHQIEVDRRIEAITDDAEGDQDAPEDNEDDETNGRVKRKHYEEIRGLVTSYIQLHHDKLKEATVILELTLWKAMLSESMRAMSKNIKVASRRECRINGGQFLEVVIPRVLSFL